MHKRTIYRPLYHIWTNRSTYGLLEACIFVRIMASSSRRAGDTMTTRECVANRIIELCNERHLAINALARISAVPPTTVKNILNGTSQNPGITTIKKLCDGLDITLIEFFDTEDFRNLEQEIR